MKRSKYISTLREDRSQAEKRSGIACVEGSFGVGMVKLIFKVAVFGWGPLKTR